MVQDSLPASCFMDPLAFLPTHSGGTSSSSSDDSDADATDLKEVASTSVGPPKDQKSKQNSSREAGAASKDRKKTAVGVSVEQLAKYGCVRR